MGTERLQAQCWCPLVPGCHTEAGGTFSAHSVYNRQERQADMEGRQTQPCSLVPVPRGAGKNGAPTPANYPVSQGEDQSW